MTAPTNSAASEFAQLRWRRPDIVEQRVDSLAEIIRRKVDALPPLTDEQRDKLLALFAPATRNPQ
jgi:hypothetical protein